MCLVDPNTCSNREICWRIKHCGSSTWWPLHPCIHLYVELTNMDLVSSQCVFDMSWCVVLVCLQNESGRWMNEWMAGHCFEYLLSFLFINYLLHEYLSFWCHLISTGAWNLGCWFSKTSEQRFGFSRYWNGIYVMKRFVLFRLHKQWVVFITSILFRFKWVTIIGVPNVAWFSRSFLCLFHAVLMCIHVDVKCTFWTYVRIYNMRNVFLYTHTYWRPSW